MDNPYGNLRFPKEPSAELRRNAARTNRWVRALARRTYKKNDTQQRAAFFGDPCGNRTYDNLRNGVKYGRNQRKTLDFGSFFMLSDRKNSSSGGKFGGNAQYLSFSPSFKRNSSERSVYVSLRAPRECPTNSLRATSATPHSWQRV